MAVLSACTLPVKPVGPVVPVVPAPVEPFSDDPVSLLVATRHFAPGAVTIVQVCVAPDHTISSTAVLESSGDVRFDNMALSWARMIRLRSVPPEGAPVAPCGQVRVELAKPSLPRVLAGPDGSLA
jgi:hypothetical protein